MYDIYCLSHASSRHVCGMEDIWRNKADYTYTTYRTIWLVPSGRVVNALVRRSNKSHSGDINTVFRLQDKSRRTCRFSSCSPRSVWSFLHTYISWSKPTICMEYRSLVFAYSSPRGRSASSERSWRHISRNFYRRTPHGKSRTDRTILNKNMLRVGIIRSRISNE